jgi:hypothetical protein
MPRLPRVDGGVISLPAHAGAWVPLGRAIVRARDLGFDSPGHPR